MTGSVFVAVALLAGAAVAVFALREHQRIAALRADCARRGWTFLREDRDLVDRWSVAPFGRGESRRARNVVSGSVDGRDFVAFEYSYTETGGAGNGRQSTTYTFVVTVLPLPVPLPTLVVAPQGWQGRLAGALGLGDEVDLESEEFNRVFAVHAEDRKFASDVLHPRHLEQLLQDPDDGWAIEGSTLLTAVDGRLDLDAVAPTVERLDRVVAQVPGFIWRDHGYDPDDRDGATRSEP